MPGFAINTTNGPDNQNAKAEFRRVHRWRFIAIEGGGAVLPNQQEWLYLSKAQRPNYKVEAPEVHHNEEVAYFAGKRTWETMTIEFYDGQTSTGGGQDISAKLYSWVNAATNIAQATTAEPIAYKKDIRLELLSGDGSPNEAWVLYNAWPMDTNWNDLDYSQSEILTVSVTLRYDRAERVAV